MIIFGIRGSKIHPLKLKQGHCPHCATTNNMWVLGHRNYFHIFWIPIFPLWKQLYATCDHCKGVFEKYKLKDPLLLNEFMSSQKDLRTTKWYLFTGSILMLLAFFFVIIIAIAQYKYTT